MRAIDLFCGAGGLTLGLRRAGWDVVAGIDVDNAVGATYESNNSEAAFMPADLRSVTVEEIRILAGTTPSNELLLAGCAPCQPFSKQRRGGPRNRGEATLLGQFARLVKELEPKVVLMENVPGITAVPGFSSLRRFLKTLHECGYECDQQILNARDFGVPQHRRRYVLLAARGSSVALPSPVEDAACDEPTVRKAIERFPALDAGEDEPSVPNHYAARLSARNLQRIRATPANGGSRRDWPEELELACHRKTLGFSDVYGRMWWDRVAPTLTSRCNSLSNGRFGHPEQNRAISLREAAALQTFPDDYEFFGAKNRIAGWIGNAVPVSFGEALGMAAMTAAV
jgi:DNA (cytosine-5)-methyltransferase 1